MSKDALRRFALRLLAVAFAACAAPASAQTSLGGMPLSVSEQFSAVVKTLGAEAMTSLVEDACGANRPLCQELAVELSKATRAALDGRNAELRQALERFFVKSSVAGMLQVTVADVLVPTDPALRRAGEAFAPFVRCLSAGLTDGAACSLQSKQVEGVEAALAELVVAGTRSAHANIDGVLDVPAITQDDVQHLVEALRRRPADVAGALRSLAELVSKAPFQRPDLEAYFKATARFFDGGLEEGLYEATWRFFARSEITGPERALINRDFTAYALWSEVPSRDAQFAAVPASCSSERVDPWREWVRARSAGYLEHARGSILRNEVPDLASVRGLLSYDEGRCPAHAATIRVLKSNARTLIGALTIGPALRRYAVLGLAAAALLDHVRTRDEVRLETSIARTVVFAAAQEVTRRATADALRIEVAKVAPAPPSLTSVSRITVEDVLRTCEFSRMQGALGVPFLVRDEGRPRCYELASRTVADLRPSSALITISRLDVDPAIAGVMREFAALSDAPDLHPVASMSVDLIERWIEPSGETWDDVEMAVQSLADAPASYADRVRLARIARLDATRGTTIADYRLGRFLNLGPYDRAQIQRATPEQVSTMPSSRRKLVEFVQQDDLADALEQLGTTSVAVVRYSAPPGTTETRARAVFGEARAVLEGMLPRVEALSPEQGAALRTVLAYARAGADGRPESVRRQLAKEASQFLVETAVALTTDVVGVDAMRCQQNARWVSAASRVGGACAARVLIQGAYRPIADFVWTGDDLTPEKAKDLGETVYRSVLGQPTLAYSPVLLHVGVGLNVVAPQRSSRFATATVVDQFGLALARYNGDRFTFETGPFVGGFLDALVRTAASVDEKFWLFGYSAGLTRMFGKPFGLELHVGGAAPFKFDQDPRLTVGASLIVPFSTIWK